MVVPANPPAEQPSHPAPQEPDFLAAASFAVPKSSGFPDTQRNPVEGDSSGAGYASHLHSMNRAADALLQTISHPASFFVLYALAMIPTYILPYFGSNSSVLNATGAALGTGALPQFWVHLTFLYILAALAWVRGGLIGRSWLPVLPVLAAVFDMTPGFNWVPLAPTAFHVATLIVGAREPLATTRLDLQGKRVTIALVGLALMILLAGYKWMTFSGNASRELQRSYGVSSSPSQSAGSGLPAATPSGGTSVVATRSSWNGAFAQPGVSGETPFRIEASVEGATLSGDVYEPATSTAAAASIQGIIDATSIRFSKFYPAGQVVIYEGTINGDTANGTWRTQHLPQMTGTFWISLRRP